MDKLIIITITIVIISIIIIFYGIYMMKSKINKITNKTDIFNDDDEMLMIRYNYVINLKKLESFTKSLFNNNIDKKLLEHIKNYVDKINNYIYDNNTYIKTISFENEMLYKNDIINLEVLFYAYNHFFNTIDKTYLKILNNKKKLETEIEKKQKSFEKNMKSFKKRSQNILKDKNNIDKYDINIENMKKTYKEYIDKLNPVQTILFIKYSIEVIEDKNDI